LRRHPKGNTPFSPESPHRKSQFFRVPYLSRNIDAPFGAKMSVGEETLFVAVVLDLYSPRVIGWPMQSTMKTECLSKKRYRTRDELGADVFNYIERSPNARCRALDDWIQQPNSV